MSEMKRGTPVPQGESEETKREYRLTGLYRQIDENEIDGRTTTGRLIKELRQELRTYVGESTIASEILINRIIYQHLRLSSYENAFIENPKHEERAHYLPMSNALRLNLMALKDLAGQKKPPPDLHGYIRKAYHCVPGKVEGEIND